MEHLLDDHENHSKQKENSQRLCDKKETSPFWVWREQSVETVMTILSEYTKRKKFTAKGRLGSENNEFKKQQECELHSKVPSIIVVGKLTIRLRLLGT